MDLVLNNLQGLICHKTKPNESVGLIRITFYSPAKSFNYYVTDKNVNTSYVFYTMN